MSVQFDGNSSNVQKGTTPPQKRHSKEEKKTDKIFENTANTKIPDAPKQPKVSKTTPPESNRLKSIQEKNFPIEPPQSEELHIPGSEINLKNTPLPEQLRKRFPKPTSIQEENIPKMPSQSEEPRIPGSNLNLKNTPLPKQLRKDFPKS